MINTIRKIELFKEINSDFLEPLILEKNIFISKYNKNKTIHEKGDFCDTLDIILEGNLGAYSLSANGAENIVFNFNEGNIIGANLIYGNNNNYPMNIYCTKDCKVLHIKKEALNELLRDYKFAMEFIKSLSNNSQGMNQKIAIYSNKSLRENIMDYFSKLSIEQNSNQIYLPITKKQLADHLGVQRPSLFRELQTLVKLEIIKVENRKITLL